MLASSLGLTSVHVFEVYVTIVTEVEETRGLSIVLSAKEGTSFPKNALATCPLFSGTETDHTLGFVMNVPCPTLLFKMNTTLSFPVMKCLICFCSASTGQFKRRL